MLGLDTFDWLFEVRRCQGNVQRDVDLVETLREAITVHRVCRVVFDELWFSTLIALQAIRVRSFSYLRHDELSQSVCVDLLL